MSGTTPQLQPQTQQRSGILFALGAYGLWGVIPAYFVLLAPLGPWEIVAWRVLLSLIFCALLLTVTRKWGAFLAVAKQPRLVGALGLAGVFIYINWQVFIYATLNEQILATSLGYFINPIVTVLLGVFLLKERLRPAQWTAVGISLIAIIVLAVGYGSVPWISLALAFSFGLYGLIKKKAGAHVDAITGLTLETIWLTPVAAIILVVVASTSGIVLGTAGTTNTMLVLMAGVLTALPLLLFASASRRLALVSIGLIQFVAPLLSFAFGAFIMGEAMPLERWIGFGLVWVALVVLMADMVSHARAARRPVPLPV